MGIHSDQGTGGGPIGPVSVFEWQQIQEAAQPPSTELLEESIHALIREAFDKGVAYGRYLEGAAQQPPPDLERLSSEKFTLPDLLNINQINKTSKIGDMDLKPGRHYD